MVQQGSKHPVVEATKDARENDTVVLPAGTTIKIRPVSAALVDAVMGRIKNPPVPTVVEEETGKVIENPGSPQYIEALQEATRKRTNATIDAFVMFGIDLPNGLPSDTAWVGKLKYLVRLGHLELGDFDLDDPVDLEFLYKRYIVANADIIQRISGASGVSGEEIEAAEASFRS